MARTATPRIASALRIGAHKSASTSIVDGLREHPDVFVPEVKEPHYFVHDEVAGRIPICVTNEGDYEGLFAHGRCARWRGEASVLYLYYHEQAIPRMIATLGTDLRILISLRNPVERAYSAYLDVLRGNALESLSFQEALRAEDQRIAAATGPPTMHYRRIGRYADQVRHYWTRSSTSR